MANATTGDELSRFYREKASHATELGVILEADDELLIAQAAATVDLIAELQADLDSNGAITVSAAGTRKVNPASVELRQQRLTLSKLTVLIDRRIREVVAGAALPGGQPGPRGVYTGDGSQNQQRGQQAAARRGRGRMAR